MASMNFDRSTVAELMSLVDDVRDELKEGTYLQMCNAMKYLHDRTQRPVPDNVQPPGTPQDSGQYTPIHTPSGPERTTNVSVASAIHAHIQWLERELVCNGRVSNADKYSVLSALFAAHSISAHGITRTNGTSTVAQMQDRIGHIVPIRTLKNMYKEAKEQRIEADRPTTRRQIIVQEATLARINRYPPEAIYDYRLHVDM